MTFVIFDFQSSDHLTLSKMKEVVEKMPSIMIERPKMPRSTWEALRAHIIRERLKKKQELEQNQEVKSI